MKKTVLIIAAWALLAGCMNRRATTPESAYKNIVPKDVTDVAEEDLLGEADGVHTARTSLDYWGTYKGVLPCADCSGIETVLTLERDGTYEIATRYLGKSDRTYTSEGTYRWDQYGQGIVLDGGDAHGYRYFVAEGRLFQLDLDGNRITGDLADHYILTKE